MPRKPLIGLATCPECGFTDAECREDKTGKAYRWCPECGSQYFARSAEQDRRLRERMRPVATGAPPPEPAPNPAPRPAPEPKPQPAPPQARTVKLLIE